MSEEPRPDMALGLDGVPHTGEAVTAEGLLVEPEAKDFGSARLAARDPQWFKYAVFYEVLVRAFKDANNDGVGDLRGLTLSLIHSATAATTSPTSARCTRRSAAWTTSCTCSTRRTAATSG